MELVSDKIHNEEESNSTNTQNEKSSNSGNNGAVQNSIEQEKNKDFEINLEDLYLNAFRQRFQMVKSNNTRNVS